MHCVGLSTYERPHRNHTRCTISKPSATYISEIQTEIFQNYTPDRYKKKGLSTGSKTNTTTAAGAQIQKRAYRQKLPPLRDGDNNLHNTSTQSTTSTSTSLGSGVDHDSRDDDSHDFTELELLDEYSPTNQPTQQATPAQLQFQLFDTLSGQRIFRNTTLLTANTIDNSQNISFVSVRMKGNLHIDPDLRKTKELKHIQKTYGNSSRVSSSPGNCEFGILCLDMEKLFKTLNSSAINIPAGTFSSSGFNNGAGVIGLQDPFSYTRYLQQQIGYDPTSCLNLKEICRKASALRDESVVSYTVVEGGHAKIEDQIVKIQVPEERWNDVGYDLRYCEDPDLMSPEFVDSKTAGGNHDDDGTSSKAGAAAKNSTALMPTAVTKQESFSILTSVPLFRNQIKNDLIEGYNTVGNVVGGANNDVSLVDQYRSAEKFEYNYIDEFEEQDLDENEFLENLDNFMTGSMDYNSDHLGANLNNEKKISLHDPFLNDLKETIVTVVIGSTSGKEENGVLDKKKNSTSTRIAELKNTVKARLIPSGAFDNVDFNLDFNLDSSHSGEDHDYNGPISGYIKADRAYYNQNLQKQDLIEEKRCKFHGIASRWCRKRVREEVLNSTAVEKNEIKRKKIKQYNAVGGVCFDFNDHDHDFELLNEVTNSGSVGLFSDDTDRAAAGLSMNTTNYLELLLNQMIEEKLKQDTGERKKFYSDRWLGFKSRQFDKDFYFITESENTSSLCEKNLQRRDIDSQGQENGIATPKSGEKARHYRKNEILDQAIRKVLGSSNFEVDNHDCQSSSPATLPKDRARQILKEWFLKVFEMEDDNSFGKFLKDELKDDDMEIILSKSYAPLTCAIYDEGASSSTETSQLSSEKPSIDHIEKGVDSVGGQSVADNNSSTKKTLSLQILHHICNDIMLKLPYLQHIFHVYRHYRADLNLDEDDTSTSKNSEQYQLNAKIAVFKSFLSDLFGVNANIDRILYSSDESFAEDINLEVSNGGLNSVRVHDHRQICEVFTDFGIGNSGNSGTSGTSGPSGTGTGPHNQQQRVITTAPTDFEFLWILFHFEPRKYFYNEIFGSVLGKFLVNVSGEFLEEKEEENPDKPLSRYTSDDSEFQYRGKISNDSDITINAYGKIVRRKSSTGSTSGINLETIAKMQELTTKTKQSNDTSFTDDAGNTYQITDDDLINDLLSRPAHGTRLTAPYALAVFLESLQKMFRLSSKIEGSVQERKHVLNLVLENCGVLFEGYLQYQQGHNNFHHMAGFNGLLDSSTQSHSTTMSLSHLRDILENIYIFVRYGFGYIDEVKVKIVERILKEKYQEEFVGNGIDDHDDVIVTPQGSRFIEADQDVDIGMGAEDPVQKDSSSRETAGNNLEYDPTTLQERIQQDLLAKMLKRRYGQYVGSFDRSSNDGNNDGDDVFGKIAEKVFKDLWCESEEKQSQEGCDHGKVGEEGSLESMDYDEVAVMLQEAVWKILFESQNALPTEENQHAASRIAKFLMNELSEKTCSHESDESSRKVFSEISMKNLSDRLSTLGSSMTELTGALQKLWIEHFRLLNDGSDMDTNDSDIEDASVAESTQPTCIGLFKKVLGDISGMNKDDFDIMDGTALEKKLMSLDEEVMDANGAAATVGHEELEEMIGSADRTQRTASTALQFFKFLWLFTNFEPVKKLQKKLVNSCVQSHLTKALLSSHPGSISPRQTESRQNLLACIDILPSSSEVTIAKTENAQSNSPSGRKNLQQLEANSRYNLDEVRAIAVARELLRSISDCLCASTNRSNHVEISNSNSGLGNHVVTEVLKRYLLSIVDQQRLKAFHNIVIDHAYDIFTQVVCEVESEFRDRHNGNLEDMMSGPPGPEEKTSKNKQADGTSTTTRNKQIEKDVKANMLVKEFIQLAENYNKQCEDNFVGNDFRSTKQERLDMKKVLGEALVAAAANEKEGISLKPPQQATTTTTTTTTTWEFSIDQYRKLHTLVDKLDLFKHGVTLILSRVLEMMSANTTRANRQTSTLTITSHDQESFIERVHNLQDSHVLEIVDKVNDEFGEIRNRLAVPSGDDAKYTNNDTVTSNEKQKITQHPKTVNKTSSSKAAGPTTTTTTRRNCPKKLSNCILLRELFTKIHGVELEDIVVARILKLYNMDKYHHVPTGMVQDDGENKVQSTTTPKSLCTLWKQNLASNLKLCYIVFLYNRDELLSLKRQNKITSLIQKHSVPITSLHGVSDEKFFNMAKGGEKFAVQDLQCEGLVQEYCGLQGGSINQENSSPTTSQNFVDHGAAPGKPFWQNDYSGTAGQNDEEETRSALAEQADLTKASDMQLESQHMAIVPVDDDISYTAKKNESDRLSRLAKLENSGVIHEPTPFNNVDGCTTLAANHLALFLTFFLGTKQFHGSKKYNNRNTGENFSRKTYLLLNEVRTLLKHVDLFKQEYAGLRKVIIGAAGNVTDSRNNLQIVEKGANNSGLKQSTSGGLTSAFQLQKALALVYSSTSGSLGQDQDHTVQQSGQQQSWATSLPLPVIKQMFYDYDFDKNGILHEFELMWLLSSIKNPLLYWQKYRIEKHLLLYTKRESVFLFLIELKQCRELIRDYLKTTDDALVDVVEREIVRGYCRMEKNRQENDQAKVENDIIVADADVDNGANLAKAIPRETLESLQSIIDYTIKETKEDFAKMIDSNLNVIFGKWTGEIFGPKTVVLKESLHGKDFQGNSRYEKVEYGKVSKDQKRFLVIQPGNAVHAQDVGAVLQVLDLYREKFGFLRQKVVEFCVESYVSSLEEEVREGEYVGRKISGVGSSNRNSENNDDGDEDDENSSDQENSDLNSEKSVEIEMSRGADRRYTAGSIVQPDSRHSSFKNSSSASSSKKASRSSSIRKKKSSTLEVTPEMIQELLTEVFAKAIEDLCDYLVVQRATISDDAHIRRAPRATAAGDHSSLHVKDLIMRFIDERFGTKDEKSSNISAAVPVSGHPERGSRKLPAAAAIRIRRASRKYSRGSCAPDADAAKLAAQLVATAEEGDDHDGIDIGRHDSILGSVNVLSAEEGFLESKGFKSNSLGTRDSDSGSKFGQQQIGAEKSSESGGAPKSQQTQKRTQSQNKSLISKLQDANISIPELEYFVDVISDQISTDIFLNKRSVDDYMTLSEMENPMDNFNNYMNPFYDFPGQQYGKQQQQQQQHLKLTESFVSTFGSKGNQDNLRLNLLLEDSGMGDGEDESDDENDEDAPSTTKKSAAIFKHSVRFPKEDIAKNLINRATPLIVLPITQDKIRDMIEDLYEIEVQTDEFIDFLNDMNWDQDEKRISEFEFTWSLFNFDFRKYNAVKADTAESYAKRRKRRKAVIKREAWLRKNDPNYVSNLPAEKGGGGLVKSKNFDVNKINSDAEIATLSNSTGKRPLIPWDYGDATINSFNDMPAPKSAATSAATSPSASEQLKRDRERMYEEEHVVDPLSQKVLLIKMSKFNMDGLLVLLMGQVFPEGAQGIKKNLRRTEQEMLNLDDDDDATESRADTTSVVGSKAGSVLGSKEIAGGVTPNTPRSKALGGGGSSLVKSQVQQPAAIASKGFVPLTSSKRVSTVTSIAAIDGSKDVTGSKRASSAGFSSAGFSIAGGERERLGVESKNVHMSGNLQSLPGTRQSGVIFGGVSMFSPTGSKAASGGLLGGGVDSSKRMQMERESPSRAGQGRISFAIDQQPGFGMADGLTSLLDGGVSSKRPSMFSSPSMHAPGFPVGAGPQALVQQQGKQKPTKLRKQKLAWFVYRKTGRKGDFDPNAQQQEEISKYTSPDIEGASFKKKFIRKSRNQYDTEVNVLIDDSKSRTSTIKELITPRGEEQARGDLKLGTVMEGIAHDHVTSAVSTAGGKSKSGQNAKGLRKAAVRSFSGTGSSGLGAALGGVVASRAGGGPHGVKRGGSLNRGYSRGQNLRPGTQSTRFGMISQSTRNFARSARSSQDDLPAIRKVSDERNLMPKVASGLSDSAASQQIDKKQSYSFGVLGQQQGSVQKQLSKTRSPRQLNVPGGGDRPVATAAVAEQENLADQEESAGAAQLVVGKQSSKSRTNPQQFGLLEQVAVKKKLSKDNLLETERKESGGLGVSGGTGEKDPEESNPGQVVQTLYINKYGMAVLKKQPTRKLQSKEDLGSDGEQVGVPRTKSSPTLEQQSPAGQMTVEKARTANTNTSLRRGDFQAGGGVEKTRSEHTRTRNITTTPRQDTGGVPLGVEKKKSVQRMMTLSAVESDEEREPASSPEGAAGGSIRGRSPGQSPITGVQSLSPRPYSSSSMKLGSQALYPITDSAKIGKSVTLRVPPGTVSVTRGGEKVASNEKVLTEEEIKQMLRDLRSGQMSLAMGKKAISRGSSAGSGQLSRQASQLSRQASQVSRQASQVSRHASQDSLTKPRQTSDKALKEDVGGAIPILDLPTKDQLQQKRGIEKLQSQKSMQSQRTQSESDLKKVVSDETIVDHESDEKERSRTQELVAAVIIGEDEAEIVHEDSQEEKSEVAPDATDAEEWAEDDDAAAPDDDPALRDLLNKISAAQNKDASTVNEDELGIFAEPEMIKQLSIPREKVSITGEPVDVSEKEEAAQMIKKKSAEHEAKAVNDDMVRSLLVDMERWEKSESDRIDKLAGEAEKLKQAEEDALQDFLEKGKGTVNDLELQIIQGRNFRDADWAGGSDPYCVWEHCVGTGDGSSADGSGLEKVPESGESTHTNKGRTETRTNDKNPVWNYQVTIKNFNLITDKIKFSCFDDDGGAGGGWSSDDALGTKVIENIYDLLKSRDTGIGYSGGIDVELVDPEAKTKPIITIAFHCPSMVEAVAKTAKLDLLVNNIGEQDANTNSKDESSGIAMSSVENLDDSEAVPQDSQVAQNVPQVESVVVQKATESTTGQNNAERTDWEEFQDYAESSVPDEASKGHDALTDSPSQQASSENRKHDMVTRSATATGAAGASPSKIDAEQHDGKAHVDRVAKDGEKEYHDDDEEEYDEEEEYYEEDEDYDELKTDSKTDHTVTTGHDESFLEDASTMKKTQSSLPQQQQQRQHRQDSGSGALIREISGAAASAKSSSSHKSLHKQTSSYWADPIMKKGSSVIDDDGVGSVKSKKSIGRVSISGRGEKIETFDFYVPESSAGLDFMAQVQSGGSRNSRNQSSLKRVLSVKERQDEKLSQPVRRIQSVAERNAASRTASGDIEALQKRSSLKRGVSSQSGGFGFSAASEISPPRRLPDERLKIRVQFPPDCPGLGIQLEEPDRTVINWVEEDGLGERVGFEMGDRLEMSLQEIAPHVQKCKADPSYAFDIPIVRPGKLRLQIRVQFPPDCPGLGIQLEEPDFTVINWVEEGGLGERVGFEMGDRLEMSLQEIAPHVQKCKADPSYVFYIPILRPGTLTTQEGDSNTVSMSKAKSVRLKIRVQFPPDCPGLGIQLEEPDFTVINWVEEEGLGERVGFEMGDRLEMSLQEIAPHVQKCKADPSYVFYIPIVRLVPMSKAKSLKSLSFASAKSGEHRSENPYFFETQQTQQEAMAQEAMALLSKNVFEGFHNQECPSVVLSDRSCCNYNSEELLEEDFVQQKTPFSTQPAAKIEDATQNRGIDHANFINSDLMCSNGHNHQHDHHVNKSNNVTIAQIHNSMSSSFIASKNETLSKNTFDELLGSLLQVDDGEGDSEVDDEDSSRNLKFLELPQCHSSNRPRNVDQEVLVESVEVVEQDGRMVNKAFSNGEQAGCGVQSDVNFPVAFQSVGGANNNVTTDDPSHAQQRVNRDGAKRSTNNFISARSLNSVHESDDLQNVDDALKVNSHVVNTNSASRATPLTSSSGTMHVVKSSTVSAYAKSSNPKKRSLPPLSSTKPMTRKDRHQQQLQQHLNSQSSCSMNQSSFNISAEQGTIATSMVLDQLRKTNQKSSSQQQQSMHSQNCLPNDSRSLFERSLSPESLSLESFDDHRANHFEATAAAGQTQFISSPIQFIEDFNCNGFNTTATTKDLKDLLAFSQKKDDDDERRNLMIASSAAMVAQHHQAEGDDRARMIVNNSEVARIRHAIEGDHMSPIDYEELNNDRTPDKDDDAEQLDQVVDQDVKQTLGPHIDKVHQAQVEEAATGLAHRDRVLPRRRPDHAGTATVSSPPKTRKANPLLHQAGANDKYIDTLINNTVNQHSEKITRLLEPISHRESLPGNNIDATRTHGPKPLNSFPAERTFPQTTQATTLNSPNEMHQEDAFTRHVRVKPQNLEKRLLMIDENTNKMRCVKKFKEFLTQPSDDPDGPVLPSMTNIEPRAVEDRGLHPPFPAPYEQHNKDPIFDRNFKFYAFVLVTTTYDKRLHLGNRKLGVQRQFAPTCQKPIFIVKFNDRVVWDGTKLRTAGGRLFPNGRMMRFEDVVKMEEHQHRLNVKMLTTIGRPLKALPWQQEPLKSSKPLTEEPPTSSTKENNNFFSQQQKQESSQKQDSDNNYYNSSNACQAFITEDLNQLVEDEDEQLFNKPHYNYKDGSHNASYHSLYSTANANLNLINSDQAAFQDHSRGFSSSLSESSCTMSSHSNQIALEEDNDDEQDDEVFSVAGKSPSEIISVHSGISSIPGVVLGMPSKSLVKNVVQPQKNGEDATAAAEKTHGNRKFSQNENSPASMPRVINEQYHNTTATQAIIEQQHNAPSPHDSGLRALDMLEDDCEEEEEWEWEEFEEEEVPDDDEGGLLSPIAEGDHEDFDDSKPLHAAGKKLVVKKISSGQSKNAKQKQMGSLINADKAEALVSELHEGDDDESSKKVKMGAEHDVVQPVEATTQNVTSSENVAASLVPQGPIAVEATAAQADANTMPVDENAVPGGIQQLEKSNDETVGGADPTGADPTPDTMTEKILQESLFPSQDLSPAEATREIMKSLDIPHPMKAKYLKAWKRIKNGESTMDEEIQESKKVVQIATEAVVTEKQHVDEKQQQQDELPVDEEQEQQQKEGTNETVDNLATATVMDDVVTQDQTETAAVHSSLVTAREEETTARDTQHEQNAAQTTAQAHDSATVESSAAETTTAAEKCNTIDAAAENTTEETTDHNDNTIHESLLPSLEGMDKKEALRLIMNSAEIPQKKKGMYFQEWKKRKESAAATKVTVLPDITNAEVEVGHKKDEAQDATEAAAAEATEQKVQEENSVMIQDDVQDDDKVLSGDAVVEVETAKNENAEDDVVKPRQDERVKEFSIQEPPNEDPVNVDEDPPAITATGQTVVLVQNSASEEHDDLPAAVIVTGEENLPVQERLPSSRKSSKNGSVASQASISYGARAEDPQVRGPSQEKTSRLSSKASSKAPSSKGTTSKNSIIAAPPPIGPSNDPVPLLKSQSKDRIQYSQHYLEKPELIEKRKEINRARAKSFIDRVDSKKRSASKEIGSSRDIVARSDAEITSGRKKILSKLKKKLKPVALPSKPLKDRIEEIDNKFGTVKLPKKYGEIENLALDELLEKNDEREMAGRFRSELDSILVRKKPAALSSVEDVKNNVIGSEMVASSAKTERDDDLNYKHRLETQNQIAVSKNPMQRPVYSLLVNVPYVSTLNQPIPYDFKISPERDRLFLMLRMMGCENFLPNSKLQQRGESDHNKIKLGIAVFPGDSILRSVMPRNTACGFALFPKMPKVLKKDWQMSMMRGSDDNTNSGAVFLLNPVLLDDSGSSKNIMVGGMSKTVKAKNNDSADFYYLLGGPMETKVVR